MLQRLSAEHGRRTQLRYDGRRMPCILSLRRSWDAVLSSSPSDADQYDVPGQAGDVP
jgi:hypothetical protein